MISITFTALTRKAASQVDSSTNVLDAQIDGEDAEQWIKDRALTYVQSYYYINDKMAEYGWR